MSIQNACQNSGRKDRGFRSRIKLEILFRHRQYNFPVNTPGKVDCNMNSQPHEYFLHLFGKEFLDAIIAETNLLEGTILSKDHLGGCSRLVTYQS